MLLVNFVVEAQEVADGVHASQDYLFMLSPHSVHCFTFHHYGGDRRGPGRGSPPYSCPCCGPRDGIQLPDNLAQACDPLTPPPSRYQLPLTHTQSDTIILLQRVYWHRGYKAWACGPILSLSMLSGLNDCPPH